MVLWELFAIISCYFLVSSSGYMNYSQLQPSNFSMQGKHEKRPLLTTCSCITDFQKLHQSLLRISSSIFGNPGPCQASTIEIFWEKFNLLKPSIFFEKNIRPKCWQSSSLMLLLTTVYHFIETSNSSMYRAQNYADMEKCVVLI